MFDPATTALLRAVLDEVCEEVSHSESGTRSGTRAHVASRILEAVTKGDLSPDRLKQIGRKAFHDAPTVWR